MKTFNNFVESQTVSGKVIQIATLMAENEMTPNVFLKTWFDENEPELSLYLSEAGVWDGIKQAGSAVWDGMKQGAQNYKRSVNGPDAHYQAAVQSLNKLVQSIQNDPQLSQNYNGLYNNINGILSDLKSKQGDIPINKNGQWSSQNQGSFNQANNQQASAPQQNAQVTPLSNNQVAQHYRQSYSNPPQSQQNGNVAPPSVQQQNTNTSFMPQYNNGTPQQNGNVPQQQSAPQQQNLNNIANKYRKQYKNPKRNLGTINATL